MVNRFSYFIVKTTLPKIEELERKWFIVDAADQVLGRMAVRIADILRGRHKPIYTPHMDTGDYVVVVNAEKVALTGNKEEQKQYMFYSGYVGNEKYRNVADFREKRPAFIIEHAVKGMLPKNRLAREMIKKLKIYAGPDHPHEAQTPENLEL
jgi:large subunit ribosomal protein L13